jgi:DNA polymerase IIIc chi subunit
MVETMTEVIFVEVTASRMEIRACEIAEQTYAQGERLQIIAIDKEQAARLASRLLSQPEKNGCQGSHLF